MKSEIKTGSFVHVVATINKTGGDGKIMYVNPSVSTIASDAVADKDVELAAYDSNGTKIYREPVVVRRSSNEPDRPNDVGLIQADLPRTPDMKSVCLLLKGQEISRYDGGSKAPWSGGENARTGARRECRRQSAAAQDRRTRGTAAGRRRDLLCPGQAGQQGDMGHDCGEPANAGRRR